MKRKKICLIAVILSIIIFSFWYSPNHIWTTVSMDGASHGDGGRIGFSTTIWKSLAGAMVDELTVVYSSSEYARKDFEEELKDSEKIIERTNSNGSTGRDERIVKVVGNPKTRQGTAIIIRLRGRSINYINAVSIKYALAFEESWIKA